MQLPKTLFQSIVKITVLKLKFNWKMPFMSGETEEVTGSGVIISED